MTDYVDRDALIADIERSWDWDSIDGITATAVLKQTISDIKNYPAADVVGRKTLRDALYEADAITFKGLAIIDKFPAADVTDRKVGKWEKRGKQMIINLENAREQYAELGYPHRNQMKLQCSECRMLTMVDSSIGYDYCPHCGARMMEAGT